jgi:hypothetical protein
VTAKEIGRPHAAAHPFRFLSVHSRHSRPVAVPRLGLGRVARSVDVIKGAAERNLGTVLLE